jgi:hypothetical protein
MENNIIKLIDKLIREVKNKVDLNGMSTADIFIILTFEILRGEIVNERLSQITISAILEIGANTSHFYYYRDYPELYKKLQNGLNEIYKIDPRFLLADIELIGSEIKNWQDYLEKSTKELLASSHIEYYYKKKNK